LPITEIKTTREFFDYQAKYENESEDITPAELNEKVVAD
jgi:D-alanine-D-alanine ligase